MSFYLKAQIHDTCLLIKIKDLPEKVQVFLNCKSQYGKDQRQKNGRICTGINDSSPFEHLHLLLLSIEGSLLI